MDTFQALADPTRRRIVEIIATKGSISATNISAQFTVSAPAISQHLKILREARIVDMEKKAQQRIYSINSTSIGKVSQWIENLKRRWEETYQRLDKVLQEEMQIRQKAEKGGE